MVHEASRPPQEKRRWNRLFPTHQQDLHHHDVDGTGRSEGGVAAIVLAAVERRNLALLGRFALLGVAAYAFNTGFKIHNGPGTVWVILQILLYIVALGCLVSALVMRDGWSTRIQNSVALVLGVTIVVAVGFEITVLNPNYATDVMAFAHGGGEILLEGNNPYQASRVDVADIADRFGIVLTRTSDGRVIDWLISYPAMHVLSYTSFLAVGFTDLRWGTLLVELAALAVVWRALSPKGRLLAPLVLLMEPYLSVIFTGGGVTDWLWVLPVTLVAINLFRRSFGYAGIALGLACAVKQHPWFVAPFVVIWVVQTLRSENGGTLTPEGRRSVGGFLAGLGAGFVLPNLPFILWDPASWFQSVLSPALGGLAADGHGLTLFVARELMEVPPEVFMALVAVGIVGGLAVYVRYFHRLSDLLWVIPPLIMFVSYRSLHSYFVFWLPVALLWLDLRRDEPLLSSRHF